MGSSRKILTTSTSVQMAPDIQTPRWCKYNPDDDSDSETSPALPPFDASESNYVRLHQERADYERERWQKSEGPISTPRRKASKKIRPIFPTPQQCAYYLHTALANISGSRKPNHPQKKQIPSEHKAIIRALASVEEVLNSQIQHLSQHFATSNPASGKEKRYPLHPSPQRNHSAPFSPTVESGLNFLFHITATFSALASPMLTELTNAAKQLDAGFKPNAPNPTFAALNKHFNGNNSDASNGPENRPLTSANGTRAKPTMSDLAAEIRRLIPEQYTFLKANFTLNPNYRLEGSNRSLAEIGASCEDAERFRPRTPPPSPPTQVAKRPRASGVNAKSTVGKSARKGKRGRPSSATTKARRNRCSSPLRMLDRCSFEAPLTKRPRQETVSITLPPTPRAPKAASPPLRSLPAVSDVREPSRAAAGPSSTSGYTQRQKNVAMGSSSAVAPSPQNGHQNCGMKDGTFAPAMFQVPSDARQKLRENVKRRLPDVRTEEDEYGLHAYALEDDEYEQSLSSASSRSDSISISPSTFDAHGDADVCKTRQRITFHQVVDVDEPDVVEQPTVVDLDA